MLTILALQLLHGCNYIDKFASDLAEDPYDIDVIYVNWTPSADQEADIDAALALWESAITEGHPAAVYNTTQEDIDAVPLAEFCQPVDDMVDDLLLWVMVDPDVVGPLAVSKVCHVDYGASGLPRTGVIRLSQDFADGNTYANQFAAVMAHEVGHVIVYTNRTWNLDQDGDSVPELELIPGFEGDCYEDSEPYYEGEAGVAAWHALGGEGGVPMEPGDTPSLHSGCTHLSDSVFPDAMMGAYASSGMDLGIDTISMGMLQDVGYEVDESQAIVTTVNLGD